MNYLKKKTLLLFICIAASSMMYAQSAYKLNSGTTTSMKLSGTSSLHKWSMNSKTCNGDAQFNVKDGGALTSLNALTFTLAVLTLKSGEKKLDKNAYKALKTDTYKTILYKLTSATVSTVKGNKYLVKTKGNLSIAGVTKAIAMDVYCTVNKDESITCTGTNKMNMTDYNVKPPTFMAGAMKTGDAITLDFTMVYKK